MNNSDILLGETDIKEIQVMSNKLRLAIDITEKRVEVIEFEADAARNELETMGEFLDEIEGLFGYG